jgi:hypothetical protein
MIQTGFESRVKIQDIINNQIPEFILDESPKFSDFLKQYYISQEYQGATIDIVENLDQYKKVDNLIPEVIIGFTGLSTNVSSSSGIVTVTSTKGFPPKYGLLKIDDEIITYTGITSNTFTGCIRGFSGITSYHADLNSQELVFSTSTAASHNALSHVQNLSALFLQEFYKKTKYTLTPELENLNFTPNLNVGNFIKSSRNLYESKGTDESFRILFNVLFGETPKVVDLEQFLFKPSSATYTKREVVVAEAISGDPLKLSGQTIIKNTDENSTASVSEVEIIRRGGKTYYKLFLFVGYDNAFPTVTGTFDITGSTKNIESVSIGGSIITVDSTIGFPPTGKIYSGINTISYTNKSINQFFGCSGITSSIPISSVIRSDEIYYGYEGGDTSKKVELRLTGVLSKYKPIYENSTIDVGESILVKSIGENIKNTDASYKEIFANSWIYNTSSRYEIDTFSPGSISQLILKSNIDKSSLKVGDYIDILNRDSQTVVGSGLSISQISGKQITTIESFSLNKSFNYDIRRRIKKSSSSVVPLEFNSITSDIQNVYNENDEYMYVASNSLPSYNIKKGIFSYNATEVNGRDDETGFYSIIKFSTSVSFLDGSEVYYKPSQSPISGLNEGIYYVEVVNGTNNLQIKLYNSRSVVGTNNCVQFGNLTSGTHNFTLSSQKDGKISPQKLLRKFPFNHNIKDRESDLTDPGYIGMLINGVEILNYKSNDKIYYGPVSDVKVLNGGSDYDVVNPPLLEFSDGNALVQPIVSGFVEKIYVDPLDFNIDVIISANLTGGNGKGATFEPVIERINREMEFDAREISSGGGVDTTSETITFLSNHNLVDGQPIIYNPAANPPLGIGTVADANITLTNGSKYYTKYISDTTIQLYPSFSDYKSGINTVGFTTVGNSGIQKFLTETKNTLTQIKVINGGSEYTNRKLRILPSGVSTSNSYLYYSNHGFNDGELVSYSNTGISTTLSYPISGISTLKQYYILKEDENKFKIADAGIGGTIVSNYQRRKPISLGSTGTGYHIFNYPDISMKVEYTAVGLGSTQYRGTINATPVVKGKIVGTYVYNNGTDYGSSILNYNKNPTIKIKNGLYAQFIPVIIGGKIKSISTQYGGIEYYSTPDLKVVGDGTGAIIKPIIVNNRISNVIVLNSGSGYSQDNTSIVVVPSGKDAIFDVQIRSLTVNNNILYDDINDSSLVTNEIIKSSYNNLEYSVSGYSGFIQNIFKDDGSKHSPIIGWAYDGNPIYGSYGYKDPQNINSGIKKLVSGYSLNQSNVFNRPSGFVSGFFIDDYKFTNSGDLDECNGRYCLTPEFPNGVYAYFSTTVTDANANIIGSFPYFIGNRYRSKFISENKKLNQSFDFNNSNLIRNTFPYKVNDQYGGNDFIIESNELTSQTAVVESVTKGSIDSFDIINSGKNYQVGDLVTFDETSTGGEGLYVKVSSVYGKQITNLQTNAVSYDNVTFTWKNGQEIKATINPQHSLENLDYVTISGFSTSFSSLNGFYQIGVTSYTTSLSRNIPSYSSTGIVTDIYISNIPDSVSIGNTFTIDGESFSVLNIFKYDNVIRASRNTNGGIHTSTSVVYFSPNSFTLQKSLDYFDSTVDDLVYFNPINSIGLGTVSGTGITVNNTIGITTRTAYVQTQSIYLPNHPFKTNQRVILNKPGSTSAISVANTSSSAAFSIPFTGNQQTVYVIKKSDDYIGIVTEVGLTTTTNGLYFITNGDNNYQYFFQSDYNKVRGNIKKIVSTLSISTSHNLKYGDQIDLSVVPNLSVGIGTSTAINVSYDSVRNKVIINPVKFSSSAVNTSKGEITILNHNFNTGQKVIYTATTVSAGLSTGFYYVYVVDENTIKLCETKNDSISVNPLFVNITSSSGSNEILSPINPPLYPIKGNNIVFDLSNSSLNGYNFKVFYDENFEDEFISVGTANTFSVIKNGIPGVSANASAIINSNQISFPLFYTLEKSGQTISADTEINNYSQINFIDSYYNGSYNISGVGQSTFNISLQIKPEKYTYYNFECENLSYTTKSPTALGGVFKVRTISSGSNFKKLPVFDSVQSQYGNGAYIIPKSNKIGRVNQTKIFNEGFEYSSDKTLKPEAEISKSLVIENSNTIARISIVDGGKNYTVSPDLIIVNSDTGEEIDSGSLIANVDGTSISSVIIKQPPSGLPQSTAKIFAINNTNGVGIQTIQSSNSGIVTCTLATPQTGFSVEPFEKYDTIFVEGIKKYGSDGDGFNSSDYGYNFFTIKEYYNAGTQLPRQIEFDTGSNPGIADTIIGIYGNIINYKNYPKFNVVQGFSNFIIGEYLQVNEQSVFVDVQLKIVESNKNYVKILGSYNLEVGKTIRGNQSGTIATISDIKESKGQFQINYSNIKNLGWSDNIGKLDDDMQVISDNDYYQNLSYSVKSNQTWENIVSPVNSLLHTSGLKNFADTQIVRNVGIGITALQYADILYQLVDENRVDTINNFDLVLDVDSDGNSSKYLKFKNKKLSDYIECRTNRVIQIDDISSSFSENQYSFNLNDQGIPIFSKTFNPSDSTVIDLYTGKFNISNHLFSTGEELIYSSNSSTSMGIGSTLNNVGVVTNILPPTLYAIKIDKDSFKVATRKEYALSNPAIGVTFTSVGIGETHEFEMVNKNNKCIISIDNIVQSPIAYSLLTYTVNNGGAIGSATTIIGLSGISSISLGDLLKIDNEYMKVINVGLGTTVSGPISFTGTFPLVSVQRGFVGTSATSHSNSSLASLYRGSFNIVRNKIYFTDPPRGNAGTQTYTDTYNLPEPKSYFNGRVFLKNDYTSNQIFDNISEKFTGIGQTYTLTTNGINTVGLGSIGGNGIVFINGIFQTPTTENNTNNNFKIVENSSVGITSIVFSGITSSNGSIFISYSDVNLNQLPRGGMIVSLGSTPGLGYASLVGASVTAIISGGSIVSIGIGTKGNWGSGYRSPVSIAVTESGHTGTGATITASVGAGGTLSFSIVNGGSGYTNPTISISPPSYSNLPVTGVSRLSVGSTTETGVGLLLNIEVGASSTTGIGSTLFEVTGFKIVRSGYGFKRGDVIKAVGLVTDYGLSYPVSEFQLTVLETFTDSFSAWQFGEMDYIDSVKLYQDGVRTRFPLYYNSQLLSFEKNSSNNDSQLIDFNNLLIIFINGILQQPGVAYQFNGGTSFTFTQAPKLEDIVSIFFYRGSNSDSTLVNINETIKIGDSVKSFSNNNYLGVTTTQDSRDVVDISSSDKIQTNDYIRQGIDLQANKPLNLSWTKQKTDKIVDGQIIYKTRDINESQVYPTAKIIRNITTSDNQIFVDNVNLFGYDSPIKFDGIIISGSTDPVSAAITATVSAAGTIQSLTINDVGSGYVGTTTHIKISSPVGKSAIGYAITGSSGIVTDVIITYGGYQYNSPPTVRFENPKIIGVGIGSTATGTANITNGAVTSVTIVSPGYGYNVFPSVIFSSPGITTATATASISNGSLTGAVTIINPGFGYSSLNPPKVIAPVPSGSYENIKNIAGIGGSFGNIVAISTTTGIGTNLALKFTLDPSLSPFAGLSTGYPIYIYNTSVGSGTTTLDNSSNTLGVSTIFLDNIYYISAFNPNVGIITCNISNSSSVVGIATTGNTVGKFSWGRIYNFTRSTNPISISVSGYLVNSGLSTFPTIQRRGFGLRNIGPIKKSFTI